MGQLRSLKKTLIYVFLIVAGLINIFPILWMLSLSLKKRAIAMEIPPKFLFWPTLESYRFVLIEHLGPFQVDFFHHAKNSLLLASISTIVSLLIGALTAYALVRFKFKGRKQISFLVIMIRMLPPIAMIVPLFVLMLNLNLLDTHLGLVLAYSMLHTPLAIWLITGFLSRLPYEIEEAALIDGCTQFGVLLKIVLPLIAPALVAIGFYTFIGVWNDFTIALVLTMRKVVTLPLMVASFIGYEEPMQWGPFCATGVLILIPPILFTLFFHKHLVKGLAGGGVKG